MRTNKKALRKHKRQEPNLTPLLKRHFDELQFDLRLKFNTPVVLDGETVSEAWVGSDGPVKSRHEAVYFTTGPEGESRHFIMRWFIEESGMDWLRNVPERHLEIDSSLGEM